MDESYRALVRILDGAAALPTWDAETLQSVVGELRSVNAGLDFDWDLGAGVEWCFVYLGDERVAAIRAPTTVTSAARFAFTLAGSRDAAEIRAILRRAAAETVEVNDFEAAVFSIDPDDFAAFAGMDVASVERAFDPTQFTAGDLIFITE